MVKVNHKKIFIGISLVSLLTTTPLKAQENPRETLIVKVIRNNASAVVNISTERIVLLRESPSWGNYGRDLDIFYDQFFDSYAPTRALKFKSVGSGVILDKSGVVITNSHVVNKASNIIVIFNDGSTADGVLMYENPQDDLAVIKIEPAKPFKEVRLGKTDDLMMGETVVAIGNPLGLENSVSAGIISGKNRNLHDRNGNVVVEGLLQTDAPINPGNSGGALINMNGELIGINVAVVENSQSIGFAIPVEKVKEALKFYEQNKNLPVRQFPKRFLIDQPRANQNVMEDEQNWDPYQEMAQMRKQMDDMFQNFLGKMDKAPSGSKLLESKNFFDPNIEIQEEKTNYVINLDISDLDKNKVNVDIHEDSITISGQYIKDVSEKLSSGEVRSHSYGSMLKTLPLPKDADTGKVKTEIKGNQLTVTIPKKK